MYSDNGKRELQQLRTTFLDIKQKLGELSQVLTCYQHRKAELSSGPRNPAALAAEVALPCIQQGGPEMACMALGMICLIFCSQD